MSIKSFNFLIGRCPLLKPNNLRCFHSLISKNKFILYPRCVPIQVLRCVEASFHLNLYASNQEKLSKESQNVFEVQPLDFENISFNQSVSHEDLISSLQKYDSVVDQMKCLAETLALTPEDIEQRMKFCKTIESLFLPFFNDFRIQMFGSSVNCFGFKGCDLDMIFETSAKQKDKSCYLERPDVPLVSEVLSGKVSPQELSELPNREQLLFIHSVFLEFYKDSEVPAKFINAHVPLVRFYHDKLNLKCDLTIKNKVAFANTKLLYLYAKLDCRIVPLIMTLRYWAKKVELIGKGLMFNTYTISLLVIYYLQTRNPPILPSAEFVLSLSDKFDTEDMNDKSFLDLIGLITPTKNNQTLDELLKEFFFFYLYFDFTRVIRPLTGSSEPREEFFSKEENSRFRMNSFCVQDPLCCTHNVAELVDFKHCRKFFTDIMYICRLYQSDLIPNSKTNKCNLITILNTPKISVEKNVSLSLPLVSKDSKLTIEEKIMSSAQTLLHLLQHILLFDCQTLTLQQIVSLLKHQDDLVAQRKKEWEIKTQSKLMPEEVIPHLKNRKKRTQSDDNKDSSYPYAERFSEESLSEQFKTFNSGNKLILCAKCNVSQNTWLGRDSVQLKDLTSHNLLAQEQLISKQVAKDNALNLIEEKIKPFLFLFECYTSSTNPEELLVIFRPLQRMSFNPILGIFLKEYIPRIMKRISD